MSQRRATLDHLKSRTTPVRKALHDRLGHHPHRPGIPVPSLVPTFAFAHILLVFGVILLVVGIIMAILGSTGRAVGGRRHYY